MKIFLQDFTTAGMPPNVFSHPRGRGGKGDNKVLSVVPPVHSLAAVKPDPFEVQTMSLAEKVNMTKL